MNLNSIPTENRHNTFSSQNNSFVLSAWEKSTFLNERIIKHLHLVCLPNNLDSHSSWDFWSILGGLTGGTVAMVTRRAGSEVDRLSTDSAFGFTVANGECDWFKELPELLWDKSSNWKFYQDLYKTGFWIVIVQFGLAKISFLILILCHKIHTEWNWCQLQYILYIFGNGEC